MSIKGVVGKLSYDRAISIARDWAEWRDFSDGRDEYQVAIESEKINFLRLQRQTFRIELMKSAEAGPSTVISKQHMPFGFVRLVNIIPDDIGVEHLVDWERNTLVFKIPGRQMIFEHRHQPWIFRADFQCLALIKGGAYWPYNHRREAIMATKRKKR